MHTWFEQNETLIAWLAIASAVTFVLSLALVPLLVARMPADYFTRESKRLPPTPLRLAARILKNLFGLILLLLGIAMLVLPGQGLLTILISLTLLDFPGKRRLELRIVRLPALRRPIAWLRRKAHRPPLQFP